MLIPARQCLGIFCLYKLRPGQYLSNEISLKRAPEGWFSFDTSYHLDRINTLLIVASFAFLWTLKVGEFVLRQLKPVPVKSHGRRRKSLFRAGLHYLRHLLTNSVTKKRELDLCSRLLSYTWLRRTISKSIKKPAPQKRSSLLPSDHPIPALSPRPASLSGQTRRAPTGQRRVLPLPSPRPRGGRPWRTPCP